MARPKGAKNKSKAPVVEGGNPLFNLSDAKPVDPNWKDIAPTAITEEDLALERELERMALESPIPDIDPDIAKPLTKEKVSLEHLRDQVDGEYRAAKTLNELDQQVSVAKRLGCDSIDAAPEIIRYYCGKDYSESHGFFMYKDIKVHFPQTYEAVKARAKMTVEQKLFGSSKVK